MSDTMPERCCQSYKCDLCHTVYVPEQRALQAEANVSKLVKDINEEFTPAIQEANRRALDAERERDWLIECINAGGHRCSSGSVARTYPALLCSGCRSSYDKSVVHFVNGERMKEMDADFKALLPLARLGLWATDNLGAMYPEFLASGMFEKIEEMGIQFESMDTNDLYLDTPNTKAARAILDREGV